MWELTAPWWEFVARGLIVYASVMLLLRIGGKRQIGQLTPFDLVLLLIISNAVQNAMNAGDNSVLAGLILAATLVAVNVLMGWLSWRSKRFEDVLEGSPQILIRAGTLDREVMKNALITKDDLHKVLRRAGCVHIAEVHYAVLETDGTISVLRGTDLSPADKQASKAIWQVVEDDTPV